LSASSTCVYKTQMSMAKASLGETKKASEDSLAVGCPES